MPRDWGQCCVYFGVYFMILFSFVGGASYIFGGVKLLGGEHNRIGTAAIAWGVFIIITGILLLAGVITGKSRCVMVYITLIVLGLLTLTVYILYFGIRNFGKFQDLYYILNFSVNVVFLCITSGAQFCVYFFYKELAEKRKTSSVTTTNVRIIL